MRRTKEEAEQTKQAILDAAIDVFTTHGVARATLEQIARSADVTRGAVYWHFKNKIEIFDALHEKLHTPFIDRIMQGLEVKHPNPVDQLQTICTNLILDLHKNSQKCKAIRLFMFKCDYSGDFEQCKARHNAKKREKLEAFEAYFARAKEQNTLTDDADPKVLALSVSCFIRGVVAEYLESPDSFKIQQDVPDIMQLFFRGILTPNKSD